MQPNKDPLEERLKKIEERLNALESKGNYYSSSPPPPPPWRQTEPSSSTLRPVRKPYTSLFLWIKENWLMGVGIFLVLLAASWFVGYSFANNWISEKTRIGLSFISGAFFYVCGILLINSRPRGAQALICSGEILAVLAIYAGHALYAIIPAAPAFAALAMITLCTALLSMLRKMEGVGLISILLAMLIPLMVSAENPNYLFLISYVFLIDILALLMFGICGWDSTFNIAWIATLTYSPAISSLKTPYIVYIFPFLFYLIFYLPTAYCATAIDKAKYSLKLNFILLTSTLALMLWIPYIENRNASISVSLIYYLAAACLSCYFGYKMSENWPHIYKQQSRLVSACILAFNAMFFLFLASEQLDKLLPFKLNVIYYLIAIPMGVAIARFLLKSPLTAIGLNLFFLWPLVLLSHNSHLPYAPFNSMDFATLCTTLLSFTAAACCITQLEVPQQYKKIYEFITAFLWIALGVFMMIFIWNLCHNLIANNIVARGVAMVVYTICGEVCLFLGKWKQLGFIRLGGFALIMFVLLRLFIVELWLMPVIIRTTTFVITGLLLVATAFFDKKTKVT